MTTGEKRALKVIMGKATKKNIMELAVNLPEDEIENAEKAFFRQGPRLWNFWCQAKEKRMKTP